MGRTEVHQPPSPTGMALVTVHAVVHISVGVGMVEVRGIIAAMALGALEDGVVVGVGMAGCAHPVGVAMVDREARVLGVVECRRCPA